MAKTTKKPAKKLGAEEKVEKKAPVYAVEVSSSGVDYKAKGDDLSALLMAFPAPAMLNTKTTVFVKKGKKEAQKDLKVAEARMIFNGNNTTAFQLLVINLERILS